MTQVLYRYAKVAVAIGAIMIAIAGRESRAEGTQLVFDLSNAKISSSGSLVVDDSYGVTIKGFNRLRKRIAVTVAGRDVFREKLGPFKTPSNTMGGTQSGILATKIGTPVAAISSLEELRDRGERIVDTAYSFVSPNERDLDALVGMNGKLQGFLMELAEENSGFDGTGKLSVAYGATIRQIFAQVHRMTTKDPEAAAQKDAILSKEDDYLTFAKHAGQAFDMIADRTLNRITKGPYQATNDVITVTITITEVDQDGNEATEPSTHNFDFHVTNGFKIDFSAGIMYTKLEDNSFRTVANGTTPETYSVVGSKQGGSIQTTTFIHFRGLFNTPRTVGLSLGMALEERPYYALGFSLHSESTRQRLVLTVGVAFRAVTRYEGPTTIASTEFQTVTKFVQNGFLGLSYNF